MHKTMTLSMTLGWRVKNRQARERLCLQGRGDARKVPAFAIY
jgi:hypothetical protein